ncbi:MAG: precorrin-3B C(17)-methyltransferase [Cyanophyceae cyanobacterium]
MTGNQFRFSQALAPYFPLAAIATTPQAVQTLTPLGQSANIRIWVPPSLSRDNTQVYTASLKEHIGSLWSSHRAFVFCLAVGAVVRLIAPLLEDKASDPAVVVVTPDGRTVISLCSGHQGGADRLAQILARQLNATPIITGSSALLKLPGIDVLGEPFGWRRGEGDWTEVSAAIARGDTVQVIQEAGSTLWQEQLPPQHPFYFGFPEQTKTNKASIAPKARVWISPTARKFSPQSDFPKAQWHPRVLWVGVGCERGTSARTIAAAVEQVCQRAHLAQEAIAGVATIALKADEAGILKLCRDRFPLKTFSAAQLRQVAVPTPSEVVEQAVGTPSVAEAAAMLACSESHLLVPKQVFRLEGEPGAVTVAIAQSTLEYTGRTGQLWLIGTGPGNLAQITPAAQAAITAADVVVGYTLYLELIAPLQRPGQIVEAFPITQEKQRAQRAIELAQWGLSVAVASSGDCGIYGMAGLVLEELQAQGWDGKTPQVQVFPGITALQAAAARVGAPLMHDFCAVSLSDLLTPWKVIQQRLEAAAAADFVTALYNPRSQTRTQQIVAAQQIFLQHRASTTPVAIVRSAYRDDEQVTLTTLEKMLQFPIDMLTTVLIGNGSTRLFANWMISPRGYR